MEVLGMIHIILLQGYSLSESPSQRSTAKAFNGVSICCNVAGVVWYIFLVLAAIAVFLAHYFINKSYNDQVYSFGCYSQCPPDFIETTPDYDGGSGCLMVCS